jgi:hypothetical protein
MICLVFQADAARILNGSHFVADGLTEVVSPMDALVACSVTGSQHGIQICLWRGFEEFTATLSISASDSSFSQSARHMAS